VNFHVEFFCNVRNRKAGRATGATPAAAVRGEVKKSAVAVGAALS